MRIPAVIAFAALATSAEAQPGVLDSVLRANRFELRLVNGELTGPGAEFLRRETRGTQFTMLGEMHNNADLPRHAAALFRLLAREAGYGYLVAESGPAIVAPVALAAEKGGLPAIHALVRQYPNALQFVADEELELYADVVKTSRAPGPRIWGVDQEFGGLHSLERLRALAPNASAGALVARVAERARPFETERYTDERYISRLARMADFDSIAAAFAASPESEASRLIEGLRTSHRIYQNNIHAVARMSGYESNREREELMKTQFIDAYDAARRASKANALPRALVKMGHYHVIRGRNWGNQYSLGDFLVNLARANGAKSLVIGAYANNVSGDYGVLTANADYGPIATIAQPGSTAIIDLRPLRAFAHAGRVTLTPEQARAVYGFDALLFIGATTRAKFSTIGR